MSGLKTRSGAVFLILAAAVLLAIIILLCSGPEQDGASVDARIAYLAALGWEVSPESERRQDTVLPEEFEGVIGEYNALQEAQGFDLRPYAGKPCEVYSYSVTNYPNGDPAVIAQLLICEGVIIGGDIHSAALDGFMHGLK